MASGIEIIKGQLDQLKAQREQIYNEQLLPLEDAITSLEKLVGSTNGKFEKAKTSVAKSTPKTRNVAKAKTEPASKAPTQSKSPAKSAKPPAKSNAPGQAEPATKPAEKAPAPAAKKATFKLKGDFKGKSVDEAIAQVFDAEPAKTWVTEDVVAAIAAPANKAERQTAIRSVRLFLSKGAAQGKWKKVGDTPASYTSAKAS
jgi:hypothetical protein